jgi:hypothetical protein
MSFENLTARRSIPKKIDPSVGDLATPAQSPQQLSVLENTQTPSDQLVQDLIVQAQEAETAVNGILQEIGARNTGDPVYEEYSGLLRASHQTPQEVLGQMNSVVYYPQTALTVLERELYTNSVDPAAPLTRDLWRIVYDIQTIKYTLETLWTKVFKPNKLYSKPHDKKNARRALFLEQNYLKSLTWWPAVIAELKPGAMDPDFPTLLSEQIQSGQWIATSDPGNHSDRLRLMKLLLQDGLNNQLQDFEMFQGTMDAWYGSPRAYLEKKLTGVVPYMVLTGVTDEILGFVNDLSPDALDSAGMIELQRQLSQAMFRHVQNVENDMLHRESQDHMTIRDMMVRNVLKSNMTKQYIALMDVGQSSVSSRPLRQAADLITGIRQLATEFQTFLVGLGQRKKYNSSDASTSVVAQSRVLRSAVQEAQQTKVTISL